MYATGANARQLRHGHVVVTSQRYAECAGLSHMLACAAVPTLLDDGTLIGASREVIVASPAVNGEVRFCR